jgi:membrane protein implicated in regulation of membrane protease activity
VTRFFVAKAWLGGSGVGIGVVGIATQQRWLVWLAVGLLLAAFLLRFAERREAGSR